MFTKKSAAGFTITELIVTVAVISVLGLITAQVIIDVSRSSQQRQLTLTRDQMAIWMRASASNIKNLAASLKQPENSAFYKCVCGGGCASAMPADFTLYDSTSSPAKPLPLYYYAMGIPCADQNQANCTIAVKMKFIAQCAPTLPSPTPYPPPNCGGPAEFFGITFQVMQNAVSADPTKIFKTIGSTVFVKVNELNPVGLGVCP
jgi:prepilin-type N-terminal cleavage/methylation domain-containing protein